MRLLIFPCGTEIALTIWNSVRHMPDAEVWGASSADDHGRAVFGKRYIGGLPFVDSPGFVDAFLEASEGFDLIYPAHDMAFDRLYQIPDISSRIIGCRSSEWFFCRSKMAIYDNFPEISPKVYSGRPSEWPVFVKPNIGNGSKGTKKVNNPGEWFRQDSFDKYLATEYLPGDEFTIDCFTDRHGVLRFCEGRSRERIQNGIAVRTKRVQRPEFRQYAEVISRVIKMRGQWFFQVKEDQYGGLKLLEIGPRPSGSSLLWTAHNVYLPKLSVLDAMGKDVEIEFQEADVSMDRALGHRFLFE